MARTLFAACLLYLLRVSFAHAQPFEVWPGSGIPSRFGSHQVCEQHFFHCELHNYQLGHRLGFVQADLEQCLAGEPPVGNCGGWGDGGSLWKPDSESRPGFPVFLLASDYCQDGLSLVSDVRILSKTTGTQVAGARFRTCSKNGNRNHQDVTVRTSELARLGPLLVIYRFMGQTECREVVAADVRQD